MSTYREVPVVTRLASGGGVVHERVSDGIATELPVALTYNRRSHVVMMATPADLEDFAIGFSLTERLVGSLEDIHSTRVIPRPGGIELALTIDPAWFDRLDTRRRNMAGRTGCGLCGAENIEQALRPPSPVGRSLTVSHGAVQKALQALQGHQPLQGVTGATHGAAWCDRSGAVVAAREDVGRHNALDKLIGHLYRRGYDPAEGFVLISSRASYEMVYKAAAAQIELVVAVSAPTTLAVEFAERSGVTVIGFARPGRHNVYSLGERLTEEESG